jgi:hypothetical protein
MSASADDLAALSPAERDFALRRMPVETVAESYRAANVEPADLGAALRQIDRDRLLRAATSLDEISDQLRRKPQPTPWHRVAAIAELIRSEALK